MIFYILLNQITTLFLNINLLTTLTFDSEIASYLYGGPTEDVFFSVTNNRRTLAIKPSQKERLSNLLIITRTRKYYFDLKYDGINPHQFIEVKDGVINHAMKELVTTPDYQILEGASSILFINKRDGPVTVNGQKVDKDKTDHFSKGVPIIFEGSRILN